MKQTGIKISVLTMLLVSMIFSTSYSEVTPQAFSISVMGGGYSFDDNRVALDLGKTFTLGLGYNFNQSMAAELSASYIHTDADLPGDQDIYVVQPRLDFLYHIMPDNDFVPYIAVGVSGLFFESGGIPMEDTAQVNGGLGAKLYIAQNIALRGDARYYYGFEDSDSDFALTAGIVIEFGGKKKEPERLDSDNDGVFDDEDQCPDTIEGVRVDSVGCQIKSDPYAVMEKTSDAAQALEESDKEIVVEKKKPEMIEVIVYFDYKNTAVKPEYRGDLEKLAYLMKEFPEISAVVEAHTDNIGSDQYNLKLSQERAESIRQFMTVNYNIDAGRFELRAMGESQPAAPNNTDEGRAANRRAVTITIME
ncbi:OmpA domain-containing outer membrane protein [Desulfonema limicola]|uniref:OmpA domain-containing outer membrane protein n=1 Tax=Desulfonema limicola TaxID=45656 RepID=A0A975BBH7_9BACT|nr:OmpA family protein [Desulfonema limicola]QTA82248.1 OmpA domain-containing outer membrane protein [Desulfonema limicola]